MKKQVLSVGQCALDHSNISQLLTANFEVEVHVADSHDEALRLVRGTRFDLILVNRIFDRTGTEGIATIRSLSAEAAAATVGPGTAPIMLVSNFEDAQAAAIKAGAVRGFGKSALADVQTIERLGSCLG